MARRLSESQITRDLGEALRKRLVGEAIQDLQGLNDKSQLSREFNGLQSVWEEICVQQQRVRASFWEAYLEIIDAFISVRLEGLLPYELDALWMLTFEAGDWKYEDEGQRNPYPVFSADVLTYLQDRVLNEARDWNNERIARYLQHR